MKSKGILLKIPCIALAGLIALSGHALAADIRQETMNKLQESNANSILVDKVLGYGSFYDLRLYQYLEPDDVGSTNAEWALAAGQLLELNTGVEYSAKHIDYATAYNSTNEGTTNAHNRNLGQGGNMQVALGYLASGRGAVTENNFAWDGNLNKISLSKLNGMDTIGRLESYKMFNQVYKMTYSLPTGKVTYAFNSPGFYENSSQEISAYNGLQFYNGGQVEENRAAIKEHIIKYGAVAAQIYRTDGNFIYRSGGTIESHKEYDNEGSSYSWKTKNYTKTSIVSYYSDDANKTPNEDVVIIGWDDDYQVPGAPGRGAYIVLDFNKFYTQFYANYTTRGWRGTKLYEDGINWHVSNLQTVDTKYYYVSYYDYYIESNVYGIKEFSTAKPIKTPYQYDMLGMSTVIETETSSSYAYGANVFARNTTVPEKLDSISVASSVPLKYEVYVNTKDGDLTSEKLVKVAETEELDPGYNTIYFDDTIMLTGKKFAVVVKYITTDSTLYTAKIGVQSPTMKYYQVEGEDTKEVIKSIPYWENATSAQGRSFTGTSLDNWTDLYNNAETKNMSVCIKAFTSEVPGYQIPTESIEIKQLSELGLPEEIGESIQILKGDQSQLVIEVTPEDAANKEVSWSSSNRNVVTVENDGTINAVGAGVATITAKLKNAPAISATCVIDVRVPIESFVLNKSNVTILAGETNVLAGIIGPEDATTTKIEWSSSNKEVVKVTEDGLLIGLKKGTAIVTAIIRDEAGLHTATCKVTVPESLIVDVIDVSLNKTSLTLEKGTRETLKATVFPSDATNTAVVWTSSNKNVAIVNANGRVTGLSAGTATITVTTVSGGETATCQVTVTEEPAVTPTGISLNQSSMSLEKDAKGQLTATVTPSNADDKTVIWDSSNLNVVEVDSNGRVTAIDVGTATITATTADGKHSAKCTVTVTKPVIRVTGITINKTALTLDKDQTTQIIAGTQPANADNTTIIWESNNPDVVTVDSNGTVKAVGYGVATITATTADGGYSKTCVVTVPENIPVTGIELSSEKITVTKGRTAELKVTILPETATNKDYTFEISDESIITLQGNGVKGLKAETATITFTTVDGEFSKTCTVTVVEPETELTITSDVYQISQDNIIYEITPNTTVEQFKANITTNATTVILKDKDGTELTDTDIIGTEAILELSLEVEQDNPTEPEGEPIKTTLEETFKIQINFDINGDGKLSLTDLSILKQYIMGEVELDGLFAKVADLNGDGKITLTDLSLIKQQIVDEDVEEGVEE